MTVISCTPPGTTPQRFEPPFIAEDCENGPLGASAKTARAWTSGICVGLPRNTSSYRGEDFDKHRALNRRSQRPQSHNIVVSTASKILTITPSQGPMPGEISASFALRWPSTLLCRDPLTSAHHAEHAESLGEGREGSVYTELGLFFPPRRRALLFTDT